MNLLITGGSGFVGSHLVRELYLKNNLFVILKKKNINFIKKNLTKKFNLKIENLDLIIHSANYTPSNHKNSKSLIKKNNVMLRNILNFADLNSINKIIYLSSMAVYHIPDKANYVVKESSKLNNLNNYSISKVRDEKMLLKWQRAKKNRKILILRIPGVVGKKSHGNFISELKRKFINKKVEEIKIFNLENKFNNVLHIDNLINFIKSYLKNFNKSFLIINLASKKPMKLKYLLKLILKNKMYKEKKIFNLGLDKKSFNIDISKSVRYGFKAYSARTALIKYFNYD